jgi:hypothetical protein
MVLQSPQWRGSLDRSKQPAPPGEPDPQQTWLPTQAVPPLQLQLPPVHCSPDLQLWPQAPQLSVPWSLHMPPQHSWVSPHICAPQTHWLPKQVSLAGQRWPQPPQLLGSLPVLAQPPLQQVSVVAQTTPLQAQAPPAHESGDVQA